MPSMPRNILEVRFIHIITHCAIVLLSVLALASPSFGWELVKDKEGIQIYTRDSRFENFKMFKGEVELDTSIDEAMAYLSQPALATDWLHDCSESRLLTLHSPDHYVVYQVTSAPWPVNDRDYVLDIKIERDHQKRSADIYVQALDDVKTVPRHKKRVRVTELFGRWQLQTISDKKIKLSYETEANPTGKIPAWLSNAFVIDQPFHTLQNLKLHFQNKG